MEGQSNITAAQSSYERIRDMWLAVSEIKTRTSALGELARAMAREDEENEF